MRWKLVALRLCVVGWIAVAAGCALWRERHRPPPMENPIAVPFTNCDDLWNAIVDVVDDDFDIASEQRVRQAGDVLTVGRIDTVPKTGSTILEPWRGDAADSYQRVHDTLQSIRRTAIVQVVPTGDKFLIEAIVHKELEDLARPEYSTAGAATFRNDGSLVRLEEATGVLQPTLGWIPLGRDMAMEQKLLAKIMARVGPVTARPAGWQSFFGITADQYVPPGMTPPGTTLQKPTGETLPPGVVFPPDNGVGPVETIPPAANSPSGPSF